jgi:hypothetical protein
VTTLPGVTFTGPAIDDPELLPRLPAPLAALLAEADGLAGSAELVRGEVTTPPPEPGAGA